MSRLCMFHPLEHPMDRGWVGRIDGDHVVQLAAQTLQSFFTGGGSAREHAVYPLAEVRLLAPVLHPPSIRIFDEQFSFAFANPAAIVHPGAVVDGAPPLSVLPRLSGVVGRDGAIGGYTVLAEWRAPGLEPPKDRDFAIGLGPVVVTPDELDVTLVSAGFNWSVAVELAAAGTVLYPGDIVAGPPREPLTGIEPGQGVSIAIEGVGTLEHRVAA